MNKYKIYLLNSHTFAAYNYLDYFFMGFSSVIIKWYIKNKRQLPWRMTKDPYKIWLSEIILQQTRVNQGLPYYEKFVQKFPSVHHLAMSNENVVMKTWQGLGYYSRARNLHFSAKFISRNLNGTFPETYEAIRRLKGVGDYTAAAISSIAFDLPYPVVDGNVYRVLARYFGITSPTDTSHGKKIFMQKAKMLLGRNNPGAFNQAVMEFGALQCVPANPDCDKCPLKKNCKALAGNRIDTLPVKSKKTTVRARYFNYLVFKKNNKILVKRRTGNDIWKNLYDFPLIESKHNISEKKLKMYLSTQSISIKNPLITAKHLLSHQIIHAKFWQAQSIAKNAESLFPHSKFVSPAKLASLALPKLIDAFCQKTTFLG